MGFLASVNGVITTAEEARVSVLDNGFAFGDSVYEVLRTYGGRPFAPGRHFRRLRASAGRLGIEVGLSDTELLTRADELLARAANGESYLRIVVSRGVGDCSYAFERVQGPTVVMICKPLPAYPASHYDRGVRVAAVDVRRNHPLALDPAIKSSNLLNNILAAREAQARGADEPVLLNQEGFLAEGASTNVFLGRDGTLLTPPLSAGILAGITREVVLELLASLGIPGREKALRLSDLLSADEAFLTSTTREVVPVREVDAVPIGAGAPGPLTRRVLEAFRVYAPGHCGQAALSAGASRSGRTSG
ncbi:MAG TPA: aminotransferase class IV [Vicinamibacteria bacterium]|nr:aminotransferase class IV [Vicinamibacteria bacterium]